MLPIFIEHTVYSTSREKRENAVADIEKKQAATISLKHKLECVHTHFLDKCSSTEQIYRILQAEWLQFYFFISWASQFAIEYNYTMYVYVVAGCVCVWPDI